MIEAIEVAFYNGEILCAFSTREECKTYIQKYCHDVDPFDVLIKTQYLSDYKPTGYFDR
jgi:hypothetical protein